LGCSRTHGELQVNHVADTAGFIVVYPNGVNNTWNYDLGGSINDVGFIDALIDTLNNHYSIDLERIYACGFSSGGLMCSKLACQLSHRITAVATISGGIAEKIANSFNACHAMPVLSIHGTTDPTLPYSGEAGIFSAEQTVSYWKNFNNCVDSNIVSLFDKDRSDGCTAEKTTFTNGIANSIIIFFKIINGGHTWPGGAYDAPPQFGNTNRDINTNEEIWNFFKNFCLSQLSSSVTSYSKIPINFSLFQNYPNPFNAQTIIEYQLPRAAHVRLILYNILGQKIITLIDEYQQTGRFKIRWNSKNNFGGDVPSGLYIYKLETDQFSASNKLLLLR